jgi:DNA polymerase-3 subunit epsilon
MNGLPEQPDHVINWTEPTRKKRRMTEIRNASQQPADEPLSAAPRRKVRTPRSPVPKPPLTGRYAALDFETADYGRDSACALSVVLLENERIIDRWTSLIRPPRREFVFTYLHGISWQDVKDKPAFGELWPTVSRWMGPVDFLAAHNASFDRSVLRACCDMSGHEPVSVPFLCTVKLARATWGIFPTKLSDVARHLQIPLQHHDAASDAFACAQILVKAREKGHLYEELLQKHGLKPVK